MIQRIREEQARLQSEALAAKELAAKKEEVLVNAFAPVLKLWNEVKNLNVTIYEARTLASLATVTNKYIRIGRVPGYDSWQISADYMGDTPTIEVKRSQNGELPTCIRCPLTYRDELTKFLAPIVRL
jgi:hypothetical protein